MRKRAERSGRNRKSQMLRIGNISARFEQSEVMEYSNSLLVMV
jgi:hypothetical protein